MSNKVIVETFYRSHLERVPNEIELNHWVSVIDSLGAGNFAEQIVSSPEAVAVERRRQEEQKQSSYDYRLSELQNADALFQELSAEIDDSPLEIGFSEAARASFPAWQMKRLLAAPQIRVSSNPDPSTGLIIICRHERARSFHAGRSINSIIIDENIDYATSGSREFLEYRELCAKIKLPDDASIVTKVVNLDIRGSVFPRGAVFQKATLFLNEYVGEDDWLIRRKHKYHEMIIKYFFCYNFERIVQSLDRWDVLMGTDLSRRFRAFARLRG